MISARGLGKTYQRGTEHLTVLHDLSIDIGRGEFVAIVGTSGSGKTTLLNVLGCLDTFDTGSYHLSDQNVGSMPDHQLARLRGKRIGFVFQNFNLLPRMSAIKNVELPMIYQGITRRKRQQLAIDCLCRVGLGERLDHRPAQLSGGQQQRVAIARALANEPDLIIADEPTGSLDTRTGQDIMALFLTLHKLGKTIVMVTHEPDVAAYASRTLTLRDGVLVSDQLTG